MPAVTGEFVEPLTPPFVPGFAPPESRFSKLRRKQKHQGSDGDGLPTTEPTLTKATGGTVATFPPLSPPGNVASDAAQVEPRRQVGPSAYDLPTVPPSTQPVLPPVNPVLPPVNPVTPPVNPETSPPDQAGFEQSEPDDTRPDDTEPDDARPDDTGAEYNASDPGLIPGLEHAADVHWAETTDLPASDHSPWGDLTVDPASLPPLNAGRSVGRHDIDESDPYQSDAELDSLLADLSAAVAPPADAVEEPETAQTDTQTETPAQAVEPAPAPDWPPDSVDHGSGLHGVMPPISRAERQASAQPEPMVDGPPPPVRRVVSSKRPETPLGPLDDDRPRLIAEPPSLLGDANPQIFPTEPLTDEATADHGVLGSPHLFPPSEAAAGRTRRGDHIVLGDPGLELSAHDPDIAVVRMEEIVRPPEPERRVGSARQIAVWLLLVILVAAAVFIAAVYFNWVD